MVCTKIARHQKQWLTSAYSKKDFFDLARSMVQVFSYKKKEAAVIFCARKYPGNDILNFFLKNTKQIKQSSKSVSSDKAFLNELAVICGDENIKVK